MKRRGQPRRIISLVLLCGLTVGVAIGDVRIVADPPPELIIGNANFGAAGARNSTLLSATNAVLIQLELEDGEELQVSFANLPPAVSRLKVHFSEHQLCSALFEFVEFRVQGFSNEGDAGATRATRPECGTPLEISDAIEVACDDTSGSPCSNEVSLHYRPAPEAGFISGSLVATVALAIDVTAGPAFGPTNLLVRYAVASP